MERDIEGAVAEGTGYNHGICRGEDKDAARIAHRIFAGFAELMHSGSLSTRGRMSQGARPCLLVIDD